MTAHPAHASPSAAVVVPRAAKSQVSTPRRQERPDHSDPPPPPPHQQQQDHADEQAAAAFADADDAQQFAHWRAHSDHHFALRKSMIARLQRLHPLLATDATMRYAGQFTRIPELVQRLELMLYKAAASLDEYTNLCTLERRVHSLVTLLEPLPSPTTLHKRPASSAALATSKRRRRAVSWSVSTSSSSSASKVSLAALAKPPSRLTSELSSDLLVHVFSFVDGVDTLRSVARVNRFFRREAPRLVQTLRLDVADASHARALRGHVREALAACTNLTTLVVTNSRNDGAKKNSFNMRASSCHGSDISSETVADVVMSEATPPPPRSAERFTGRELLHELSALWLGSPRRVVFPKLRRLELRAPFDCANEADATLACVHALASNLTATSHAPRALQSLVLDTTLLGDRRVGRLVALFRAFPTVFAHQLRELELRNNFVGEAGMSALCRAVSGRDASSTWRKLERLALPRNIATDGDAQALARCVDALPRLLELDVSENFIGKPGFEALADRLRPCGADGGDGQRRRVTVVTAHNCMESSEAANLFM